MQVNNVFPLSSIDVSNFAAQPTTTMDDSMDVDMDIDLAEDPEIARLEAEAMNIVSHTRASVLLHSRDESLTVNSRKRAQLLLLQRLTPTVQARKRKTNRNLRRPRFTFAVLITSLPRISAISHSSTTRQTTSSA